MTIQPVWGTFLFFMERNICRNGMVVVTLNNLFYLLLRFQFCTFYVNVDVVVFMHLNRPLLCIHFDC